MKKVLFVLLMALSLTASAQWYADGPRGAVFQENNTGTTIILNNEEFIVETTPSITNMVDIFEVQILVYDSLTHYVCTIDVDYPDVPQEVCQYLLYYTAWHQGAFIITFYGYDQDDHTYAYGIQIPTFKWQVDRDNAYKKFLRKYGTN